MKTPDHSIKKSRGTAVAEKWREKGNKFTNEEPRVLIDQGMAIIHGGLNHVN
jgi:hypothetical protein